METMNRKQELLEEITRLEDKGDLPGAMELAKEFIELKKKIESDPDLLRASMINHAKQLMKDEEDLDLAINYARRMILATGDYEYSIQDTAAEFEIQPEVIRMNLRE